MSELFMLAFFAYFLLPLFWLFVASTKSIGDLFSTFGLWFSHDFNLVPSELIEAAASMAPASCGSSARSPCGCSRPGS
jgi:ABC-type glycerol-3-phosphate transport system permease component